jgi:hypothetical protein
MSEAHEQNGWIQAVSRVGIGVEGQQQLAHFEADDTTVIGGIMQWTAQADPT